MSRCPLLLWIVRIVLEGIEFGRRVLSITVSKLEVEHGLGNVSRQSVGDMLYSEFVATRILGVSREAE